MHVSWIYIVEGTLGRENRATFSDQWKGNRRMASNSVVYTGQHGPAISHGSKRLELCNI